MNENKENDAISSPIITLMRVSTYGPAGGGQFLLLCWSGVPKKLKTNSLALFQCRRKKIRDFSSVGLLKQNEVS